MRLLVPILVALCLLAPQLAHAEPGRFVGSVVTEWLQDGRHMVLRQPFEYVSAAGERWPVPSGAMIDGASIPSILWPLVGGPFEGPYRAASVVHDYYCDVRSRPWQDVHRIFYEAMLSSGVPSAKAKLLYMAVVAAGPKWDYQAIHNENLAHPAAGRKVSEVTVSKGMVLADGPPPKSQSSGTMVLVPSSAGSLGRLLGTSADSVVARATEVTQGQVSIAGPFEVLGRPPVTVPLAEIQALADMAERENMDVPTMATIALNARAIWETAPQRAPPTVPPSKP